jgi:chorismate mutase
MSPLHDPPEALKQLRLILDAMREISALYEEREQLPDEEPVDREAEQEVMDRIVEEAAEMGMDEDGIEKVVRLLMNYCKKVAE